MLLYLNGHSFHYEMENLCRIFFPYQQITRLQGEPPEDALDYVATSLWREEGDVLLHVSCRLPEEIKIRGKRLSTDGGEDTELQMAVLLFDLLSEETGYLPQWGVLTGVRPAKLMRRLLEEKGEEGAADYFTQSLLVSPKKTALALEVAKREDSLLRRSRPQDFSLYLSIPFCPSRCSYCSFVSHSIEKAKKLLPDYLLLLEKELEVTGQLTSSLGLTLKTVYIGGGTPTVLSAEQLDRLMEAASRSFSFTHLEEYTVEAGRPDTITTEKLDVLKKNGATRLSINPQTFHDPSLEAIGRRHTAHQAEEAFWLARERGHQNINMDLIAGLPQDRVETFQATLDKVSALSPESVTVHTLALKRSSRLVEREGYSPSEEALLTARQLERVEEMTRQQGYLPYYMYRQSRTLGNLENVGYAREGYFCLYNIYMMEEVHTVAACGAGGVTKLKEPGGERLERVYNFKYPYEYISRFDELSERKQAMLTFYQS